MAHTSVISVSANCCSKIQHQLFSAHDCFMKLTQAHTQGGDINKQFLSIALHTRPSLSRGIGFRLISHASFQYRRECFVLGPPKKLKRDTPPQIGKKNKNSILLGRTEKSQENAFHLGTPHKNNQLSRPSVFVHFGIFCLSRSTRSSSFSPLKLCRPYFSLSFIRRSSL
jgi:hypothetical protein